MKRVFLGIGTNLGDRESNLEQAIEKTDKFIGPVIRASSVYETEPWGFTSENQFLNMVVEVKTDLNPSGILRRLLMIESMLGRLRESKQYSSRIIDIDILLYDNQKLETASLTIPHPKMHERIFVLAPLCEIAPEVIHPVFLKSIKTLLEECPDRCKVKKLNRI